MTRLPLLFIIVLDALHCGFDEPDWGYAMKDGTVVASLGYADDTLNFAESERHLRAMHAWTRSFFGAHAFKINSKKTNSMTTVDPAQVVCLAAVDGKGHIVPQGPNFSSRYLGVQVNLALNCDTEMSRLRKLVLSIRRITSLAVPLAPAVDAINSFLVPKMEAGLCLIPLDGQNCKEIKEWNFRIREAVLNSGHWPNARHLPRRVSCCHADY